MRNGWAGYFLWLLVALAGSSALLSGCGQKGDLYLPDREADEEKQAS
jgi:predicted small lipoprotein YifL